MVQAINFPAAQWIRSSVSPDSNRLTDASFTLYNKNRFERPLIDVIGEVARRHPSRIAIDDGATRLTYSQFYAMACHLSHAIRRAQLQPGAIGIKLSYDALHPVAILGCLAAGHPCLLMSPDHPPGYNQRLIEASGLQALLVNAAEARQSSAQGGPCLIPIESALMPSGEFDQLPVARLDIDEPAFIISTSGSTGTPKLIVRSQRSLLQTVRKNAHSQHFSENDRFLNLGAPTNAAAIRGFGYLLIGASLHLIDVTHAGMGDILRVMQNRKINVLVTTVSLMKALSQLDDARSYFASLRVVWISGEMLFQRDLVLIRAALPHSCRLSYCFGMTETTTVAEWFVPETDDHDPIRVAVGYLQPETDVLFLNEMGDPCPAGEIGELYVRSQSVALGEWVKGRLVSDRFPRDPIDSTYRIYRTGDLGRICPDGVIVMHGRSDSMIKIRGQRVEPAVIETTIRNISGVADAVVATKQINDNIRIYGFIVPSPQAGDDLRTKVINGLIAALPSYMVPSEILTVKSLPRSAIGKVDVKSLLATVISNDHATPSAPSDSAPSTSNGGASSNARGIVAKAWQTVFRTKLKISTLSFEAAGGDSLQFMQIIFRLEQLSGMSLPLGAFDVSMSQEDMACRLDFLLCGGVEAPRPGKQVFLLPGIGGDEPRLLQFRAGCAPELSITCLDYGDWMQWVEPGFGLDMIVNRLVAQIQELAPTGPLNLAGYSFGGWMALVLAARLHTAGREIENLLVLDAAAIKPLDDEKMDEAAFVKPLPTLRQEFEMVRQARWRGEGAFAIADVAARHLVRPRWAPLLRWLARHRRKVLPGRIDFYLSFCINEQYLKLMSDWPRRIRKIPRLPVPITVFRTGGMAANENSEACWSPLSSKVLVVPVGGNHFSMFDTPHLIDLCARFKTACAVGISRKLVAS